MLSISTFELVPVRNFIAAYESEFVEHILGKGNDYDEAMRLDYRKNKACCPFEIHHGPLTIHFPTANTFVGINCSWYYNNGYCYRLLKENVNVTWTKASQKCKDENAEMANVETTKTDVHFFRRLLINGGVTPQKNKIYIGKRVCQKDLWA
jgi:hypothetical protein